MSSYFAKTDVSIYDTVYHIIDNIAEQDCQYDTVYHMQMINSVESCVACSHQSLTCFTPFEQLYFFSLGFDGLMDVYRLSPVSSVIACLCHGHTTHNRPRLSCSEQIQSIHEDHW